MSLIPQIEAILFAAGNAVSVKQLAKALSKQEPDIEDALELTAKKHAEGESGMMIIRTSDSAQMVSKAEYASVVEAFTKDEIAGELTKAQLETLTVVAYRGPVTRPELEEIRGVNCALILRNLLVRGLIDEGDMEGKLGRVYTLSSDALRHLGIGSSTELPEFEVLHAHPHVERVLEGGETN